MLRPYCPRRPRAHDWAAPRSSSCCSPALLQCRGIAARRLPMAAAHKRPEDPAPLTGVGLDEPVAEPQGNGNGKVAKPVSGKPEAEASLMELDFEEEIVYKYGWLAFWLVAAAAFAGGIWAVEGAEKAQEFVAGYLLEQSLSVDNLFVFVLVFNYFHTPPSGQSKVLSYGIGSAAVLRAILIVTGVELVQQCEPILIFFAFILIASSYKLLTQQEDEDDGDLSDNDVVKLCKRFINSTSTYDGDNFFTTLEDGTRKATPLLLVLAVIELSDVLFAVDSIPAVFGVTLDPFIVYTSNIFAILSLRAVYSFVSTVMSELRYLDKAVASVLGFIGVKMCLGFVNVRIPTDVSLVVVAMTLAAGVGLSLALPEEAEDGKAG